MNYATILLILLSTLVAVSDLANAARPRRRAASSTIRFRDATVGVAEFVHEGLPTNDNFSGIAVFDFNKDDLLDILVANGQGSRCGLLRNEGNALFKDVAAESGLGDDLDGASGVAAGDLDNDGDEDIIVICEAGAVNGSFSPRAARLYRNNLIGTGDPTFTDVTAGSGLNFAAGPGVAVAAVLGDIDNDGLLDVFITAPGSLAHVREPQPKNRLLRNLGGLTFTDISQGSNVDYANGACVAAFTHYDRDNRIDLVVGDCNLGAPNPLPIPRDLPVIPVPGDLRLYTNNGDGTFRRRFDVGLPSPRGNPTWMGLWMSATPGDVNNDGRMDLFSTNAGTLLGQPHQLFVLQPSGKYLRVSPLSKLSILSPNFSWGATFEDFNNDGWGDIFFAGNFPLFFIELLSNPGYILTNQQSALGKFSVTPLDRRVLVGQYATGVASGDFNNDGFVDAVISNGSFGDDPADLQTGGLTLLLNETHGQNHWLRLKLEGTASNRSGIGAIVEVRTKQLRMTREVNGGGGFLSRNSTWLTFGLGRAESVEEVIVRWPSGLIEQFGPFDADQTIDLVEATGEPAAIAESQAGKRSPKQRRARSRRN